MPNTFHKIYLHFVFAVRGRASVIPRSRNEDIHKYITGLVQRRKSKMLAIYCMPDHLHFFVGFDPGFAIPDFVKEIKVESNQFINNEKIVPGKFSWQEGYGVFSYSESQIDNVVKYVLNQEIHHKRRSFGSEYRELLNRFNISFDEKYLFEFFDEK